MVNRIGNNDTHTQEFPLPELCACPVCSLPNLALHGKTQISKELGAKGKQGTGIALLQFVGEYVRIPAPTAIMRTHTYHSTLDA